jgi:hypothetical protein
MTLTYFTTATERANLVEAFNARLRRMHLRPRQPGQSRALDLAKVAVMRGKAAGSRLLGVQDEHGTW